MKKNVFSFTFPFIICFSFVAAQVSAGEAGVNLTPELAAGKERANKICSNCHGLYGQAVSGGNSVIVPNLTAQQKEYLVARLKNYKSGKIEHPQMSLVAKMLTEQDINNVSAWYSGIEVTVFDPNLGLSN